MRPPRFNRAFKSDRFARVQPMRVSSQDCRENKVTQFELTSKNDFRLQKQRSESRNNPERTLISDLKNIAAVNQQSSAQQLGKGKQLLSSPPATKRLGGGELTDASLKQQPQTTGKYVVKPTNQNVKAYMQFKEQANAVWNAAKQSNEDISPAQPNGSLDENQAAAATLLDDALRIGPNMLTEGNNACDKVSASEDDSEKSHQM